MTSFPLTGLNSEVAEADNHKDLEPDFADLFYKLKGSGSVGARD
jgi:hypothetical protein